jgi:hypothetical protein
MRNLLQGMLLDARLLLIGALIIMAIAFVLMTWARTRSLVPTLGSIIVGFLVVAGVSMYSTIKTGAENDITRYNNTQNGVLQGQG